MPAQVARLKKAPDRTLETVLLTPKMATELLEHNTLNRPLTQPHVDRIARQIENGKWQFNGDTIKISDDGMVLDGQHRLWAVILADKAVETILVTGIAREAFATIDTIRRARSGADILSLNGVTRYRGATSGGLTWLIHWQRLHERLPEYRNPKHKVEHSDIEAAFERHPEFVHAVERVWPCRGIVKPSILSFLYYVLYSRNEELTEVFINTLESPAGVSVNDPFFKFRARMLELIEKEKKRDPIMTMALAIKAWNARKAGKRITNLVWRNQGSSAEKFPTIAK